MDGKAVKDLRGVHTSYITSQDILAKVYAHIDFFPKKLIHYGGKERYFLSEDLNVKLMYELFMKKKERGKVQLQVLL